MQLAGGLERQPDEDVLARDADGVEDVEGVVPAQGMVSRLIYRRYLPAE